MSSPHTSIRIRTVFFDMGGTLAHPRPSFNALLSEVCRREGLDVTVEQATRAEPAVWARIAAARGGGRGFSLSPERSREFWHWVYRSFLEELGYASEEALPRRLFETFTQPENYQLFDDVLPTLDRLRAAGMRIGIISNWEGWASELLAALGLAPYVNYTVVSGSVGWEKPDAEIFHWALREAGLEPAEAMHVGDNPRDDVQGAIAVGMRAVLIDRSLEESPGLNADADLAEQFTRRAPLIPADVEESAPLPAEAITVASLLEIPSLLGL